MQIHLTAKACLFLLSLRCQPAFQGQSFQPAQTAPPAMAAKRDKKYSFPLLDAADILQILTDLSVDATIEDLRQPKPDKVQQIYSGCIEQLLSQRPEEVQVAARRHPNLYTPHRSARHWLAASYLAVVGRRTKTISLQTGRFAVHCRRCECNPHTNIPKQILPQHQSRNTERPGWAKFFVATAHKHHWPCEHRLNSSLC